jgi:hypothetical protein
VRQTRNQKPESRNHKSWRSEAFLVSDFWFLVSSGEAFLVSGFWFLTSSEVRNA